MKISTILTPADIATLSQRDLGEVTAVVFDVLRATSTMTTALENGASAIYPAADIAEARALKDKHPAALLGGERHGEKIEGFDLGNSPLEYRDLAGREIISTTTNGTVALRAVSQAGTVVASSFLNLAATARYLLAHPTAHLLLVCAGTGTEFALEDGLAAGALIEMISENKPAGIRLDDAGKILVSLWKSSADDIYGALAAARNGRRLIERGRQAEVAWCAKLDVCSTLGVLSDDALRPIHQDS